jgi:protein-S-isoprenylcysteine O-methyltransferase Ste14
VLGEVIQIFGMMLQVLALFSLNRSIGFVAANRGVKTTGMYRFVRHPLYSAYCVSFLGFVMNHPTKYNICIYCAMLLLLFMRILAEERILLRSGEYAKYTRTVRYRLIPGII